MCILTSPGLVEGASPTKALRQELVGHVLAVDRGRLGIVGRDRSRQGPDHAGPCRPQ